MPKRRASEMEQSAGENASEDKTKKKVTLTDGSTIPFDPENHILMGRGAKTNDNPANKEYVERLKTVHNKHSFKTLSKRDKSQLVEDTYVLLKQNKRKFVKKIDNSSMYLEIVDNHTIKTKISQGFIDLRRDRSKKNTLSNTNLDRLFNGPIIEAKNPSYWEDNIRNEADSNLTIHRRMFD